MIRVNVDAEAAADNLKDRKKKIFNIQ